MHILAAFISVFRKEKKLDEDGLVEVEGYPGTKIVNLILYPLTGAKGFHLDKVSLKMSGFELDREWVVLEKDKEKYTPLRKNEELAMINTEIEYKDGERWLVLSHENQKNSLILNIDNFAKDSQVEFKNNIEETIICYSENEGANKWISEILNKEVVLVRSLQRSRSRTMEGELDYQMTDGDNRNAGHLKSALHLVSMRSLEELKAHIDPNNFVVSIANFRPNIVVEGVVPWEEDDMRKFSIMNKDISFRVILHTRRWYLTRFDDRTKKFMDDGEPLTTLNKLNFVDKVGPVFGFCAQPDIAFMLLNFRVNL